MSDDTVFCHQCFEKHEAPECGELPLPPEHCAHNVHKRFPCVRCINERAAIDKVQMRLAL